MQESIAIEYSYQLTSDDVVSPANAALIAEVVPDIDGKEDIVIDLTFVSVLNQLVEAVGDDSAGKETVATLLYLLSILSSEYAVALHMQAHEDECTECAGGTNE